MFPVRASVITPTFQPHTWGLADGDVTAEQRGKELEKGMKEVAIKAAAASMAVSIAISFVPIIGTAIGACLTLVQYFTGKHYTKQTKEVIDKAVKQIKAKGASAEAETAAAYDLVYRQEFKAAQVLAASGVPLSGLGDFWSKSKKAVTRTGREIERISDSKVVKVLSRVASAPATLVVKVSRVATSGILKGVAEGASAVGMKGFARDVRKFEEKGDAYAKQIQDITDMRNMTMLVFGRQGYLVAVKKTAALKNAAFAEIDRTKHESIATMQSPDGRAAMRKQTALTMRGDPETMSLIRQVLAEEASAAAALNAAEANVHGAIDRMQPTVPDAVGVSKTTALVGTGLAAVAAYLAFR